LRNRDSETTTAVAKIAQVYSIQAQCFTLHATSIISQPGIDKMGVQQTGVFSHPGGGDAAIFGPDGRKLTENLPPTEEGLVYADLDFDLIVKEKAYLDTVGHFSRPDLLWLGRNTQTQKSVRDQPVAE
jgi:nitrilase